MTTVVHQTVHVSNILFAVDTLKNNTAHRQTPLLFQTASWQPFEQNSGARFRTTNSERAVAVP